MNSTKRSYSRRSGELSATEDSSEDSDSSGRSTEYDWKAEKTKETRSAPRSRHSDGARSSRDGGRSSSYKEKRKSKRAKKVSKDRESKRKKTKDTAGKLEHRDGVPLQQGKDLHTKKQSCMAFISSTRITPTAASHSSTGEKRPSALDGAVETMQQSSSDNDTSGTPRSVAPMSKEDYDRKRSTIRRVVDPDTGRSRLIRGEGEVLEEIVSRDRHKEINKLATKGDGQWFLKGAGLNRQT